MLIRLKDVTLNDDQQAVADDLKEATDHYCAQLRYPSKPNLRFTHDALDQLEDLIQRTEHLIENDTSTANIQLFSLAVMIRRYYLMMSGQGLQQIFVQPR